MPRASRPTATPVAADALTVRFWGVRGSVAVPGPQTVRYGGNTACVEARWGGDVIILDAGTGIRELGKSLVRELEDHPSRICILITHTHWDHIQGFPFFAPAYLARQKIRILGWRGSRSGLKRTVAASVESPFFPVALPQMPGTITVEQLSTLRFRIGQVRASAARIHHPGGGVAFRLDTPAGSLVYAPDHEIGCPDPTGGSQPAPARTTLRRQRDIRTLIHQADILIHDAQYTASEYASRIGWGHSCVDAVVRQAADAGVKHLLLFHHDPDRTDDQLDAILADARRLAASIAPSLRVDAAREGLELRLPTRATR
jgi:phosphoribosyl 1,2-cyclic phosphodiesterase